MNVNASDTPLIFWQIASILVYAYVQKCHNETTRGVHDLQKISPLLFSYHAFV